MQKKTVSITATCLVVLSSITYQCNIYGHEIYDSKKEYYEVKEAKETEKNGQAINQSLVMSNPQSAETGKADKKATDINKNVLNNIIVPKELKKIFSTVKINSTQKSIRKLPYPYRAMLAIASDTDNNTPEKFEEYHKFLNTKEKTNHGIGLGLDIGDSMWMYMGNDSTKPVDVMNNGMQHVMTFFKGTSKKKHNADFMVKYFKAGWIDSIHTFGDFSRTKSTKITFTRQLAIDAWNAMKEAGIRPTVWINHGNAYNVQNFGGTGFGMTFHYQQGDLKNSPYYHTDISIKNGIKFVWNSVGETKFGVDNPLFQIKLRDGQKVWGFHRYTNDIYYESGHKKESKISWTWNAGAIQKQITQKRLNDIVSKNQYSIVGQHLGGTNDVFPFWPEGVKDLRILAKYQDEGKILVARTSRLLNYALAQQHLKYKIVEYKGQTWINIISINDPVFGTKVPTFNDIRGIDFYLDNVDSNDSMANNSKTKELTINGLRTLEAKANDLKPIDPNKVHILLNLKPIPESEIQINSYDNIKGYTDKQSIGIKWFKADYTDYTKH